MTVLMRDLKAEQKLHASVQEEREKSSAALQAERDKLLNMLTAEAQFNRQKEMFTLMSQLHQVKLIFKRTLYFTFINVSI